jgi:hypothetical protein
MNGMLGKANAVHLVFSSTFYHLDIPQMKVAIIQYQGTGIFYDGFIKRTKYMNLCVKFAFWIHPALLTAAIELGGALTSSSAFTCSKITPEEGEHTQHSCR